MKIEYVKGNLFDGKETFIAHGCNTKGVMGSGFALALKERYPEVFEQYKSKIKEFNTLGTVLAFTTNKDKRIIFNLLTQDSYGRDKSRVYCDYEAIRKCIRYINHNFLITSYIDGSQCRPNELHRVAMPKIGAGLANGDWNIIEAIIEEESTNFQPVVYVL